MEISQKEQRRRRLGVSARSLQHPQPAGRGGARAKKGIQSREGPPGRGNPPPHPVGQIGLKRKHLGRHEGRRVLRSPQTRGSRVPWGRGGRGSCGGRGRGISPTRRPRKPRRGLSCRARSVVCTKLSFQAPRSSDPECRAGTLSGGGGLSPSTPEPAPLRVPSARGRFLLLQPPPEIWGCAPSRAGCGASHLIRGRELQLIDIEGRHQGDGVEAILQQHLFGALLREIAPQLHHGSGRPEAAACVGTARRESPRAGPARCPQLASRLVSGRCSADAAVQARGGGCCVRTGSGPAGQKRREAPRAGEGALPLPRGSTPVPGASTAAPRTPVPPAWKD